MTVRAECEMWRWELGGVHVGEFVRKVWRRCGDPWECQGWNNSPSSTGDVGNDKQTAQRSTRITTPKGKPEGRQRNQGDERATTTRGGQRRPCLQHCYNEPRAQTHQQGTRNATTTHLPPRAQ